MIHSGTHTTGKMWSYKRSIQSRFKCAINMVQLFWNIIKTICNVKLNVLLWILCVPLVILIILMSTHRDNEMVRCPVIVWWTDGFPGPRDESRKCGNSVCYVTSDRKAASEAILFYGSQINFDDLPLSNPSEVIWGLYHEESPRNTELLMHENILSLFNYSSTFSRYSDMPFVLQYLLSLDDITTTEYYVATAEKNDWLKEISPVLYLQTDCETMTERDAYVKELMKHINIDSYGDCLNNKELPDAFKQDYLNSLDEVEFLKFISRYKFTIAFENAVCEDYVTEKFWRALKVGSIPIYFGSPSIRDWLPNHKSAIILNDHRSPLELAKYLKNLLMNDSMYDEYLEHKLFHRISNERLIEEFNTKPNVNDALATAEDFECYVCLQLSENKNLEAKEPKIVNRKHYDCPKPVSALTLKANPENSWVLSWNMAETEANKVYNKILGRYRNKKIYI